MATQILFLFLFLSVVHAQNCPPAYCYGFGSTIQFPFWLQDRQPPPKCSSPGFNLSCIDRNIYLNIPSSGIFYVKSIDYSLKQIQLSDPGNCLPRRLLSFNLSSSPFLANGYDNYTFFSCPKGRVSSIEIVDCLSNSSTAIVATKYQEFYFQVYPMCRRILTVPVPTSVAILSKSESVTIDLTWIAPSNSGTGVGAGAGAASDRTIAFIIPALAVPVLIVFISCCICMRRRDSHESSYYSTQTNRGLDESTIESYKKMTISENGHIPGSNDISCSICLEDYAPNDTLRFMPGCEHCFHIECIDKWLRINRRCPVCRVDLQAHDISPC